MRFMDRLRFRVFALLFGLALTVLALISLTTIPAWPIVGVAFAAAAVAVNQLASRISPSTCHGCGNDLAGASPTTYGMLCARCGYLTLAPGAPAPGPVQEAGEPADEARADDAQAASGTERPVA